MDKVLGYFSFRGRANRKRYWLTSFGIIGVMIGGLILGVIPVVGVVLEVAVILAALVASVAVAARRIHDRGRSAWWLLAMYLPSVLLGALASVMNVGGPSDAASWNLLSLPFSIWMFVDLGCLAGTSGPNRFGDDPLGRVAEVFA